MPSPDPFSGSAPLLPADDQRTRWLMRHEAWLRLLARCEIDNRFQGKFDHSDVVQQTLLEAWKDWEQCNAEQEGQRLAWLRQILAHQLAHFARHYGGTQKRDIHRELTLDQTLGQSAQRLDALIPANDPSPSNAAQASEQRVLLTQALDRLPDDYRQVILLRNIEELSHEEVASKMNRSVGAVRMLWVRALTALRDAMQQSD